MEPIWNEHLSQLKIQLCLKPTLLEHLSSSPVFSGVRVTRSLVLYVRFVDRCLSFVFLLAIVLSVPLRYTDYDYLPLVSSNSSYSSLYVGTLPQFNTFSIII
jgi:hypothetical protein